MKLVKFKMLSLTVMFRHDWVDLEGVIRIFTLNLMNLDFCIDCALQCVHSFSLLLNKPLGCGLLHIDVIHSEHFEWLLLSAGIEHLPEWLTPMLFYIICLLWRLSFWMLRFVLFLIHSDWMITLACLVIAFRLRTLNELLFNLLLLVEGVCIMHNEADNAAES